MIYPSIRRITSSFLTCSSSGLGTVILPFCKVTEVETLSSHGQPLLGCEHAQGPDWACWRALNDLTECITVCALHLHHYPSLQCLAWIIRRNLFRVAPVPACVMGIPQRLLMRWRMVWIRVGLASGFQGTTKNPQLARKCGFHVQST